MPVGRDFIDMEAEELFRASNERFGTINNGMGDSPELIELFAPVLRNDLAAVINQNYDPWPHSHIPVTVFYSDNDIVNGLDMAKWQRYFSQPIEIMPRQGSHFHALENPDPIVRSIIETLSAASAWA
jgi:surfactin synthase thioesterase subunit